MELESEQQRHGETAKSMRRQERRLKELTAQLDEDRTTHERMHDVIDKLHQKLKTYKRQIDDAVRTPFFTICLGPGFFSHRIRRRAAQYGAVQYRAVPDPMGKYLHGILLSWHSTAPTRTRTPTRTSSPTSLRGSS